MNNKIITGVIVITIALLGLGAVTLSNNKETTPGKSNGSDNRMSSNSNKADGSTNNDVQEVDQITYKDFAVAPKVIRIKKGTTVTWKNEDAAKHDVTPDTETDDFKASELFGKGETHQVTFNTAGTYTFYCSPHPYMKGTVEVTDQS